MNVKNRFESKYKQPPTATKNINSKDKKKGIHIYTNTHSSCIFFIVVTKK